MRRYEWIPWCDYFDEMITEELKKKCKISFRCGWKCCCYSEKLIQVDKK